MMRDFVKIKLIGVYLSNSVCLKERERVVEEMASAPVYPVMQFNLAGVLR